MYRILIVEDDATIAEALCAQLTHWGFEAVCAKRFDAVLEEFLSVQPHLVLLDILLPFYNGYHWCAQIRKVSKVPVLFLSSASESMNIVMAVNMGADDFIAKPFDQGVLVAKIQALLRRSYDFHAQNSVLEHEGAMLNLSDATLSYRGQTIELTKNEYKILQLLMQNKGCAVSREEIMRQLWQSDSYVDDNTLTVNIARLRRKLDEVELTDFITTKKGMGYLIKA